MKFLRATSLLAFTVVFIWGCTSKPTFPVQPSLKFKEYIQKPNNDTLWVVFSFTDGDGDIGVSQTGTDSNFVMTVYVKNASGQYAPLPTTPLANDSVYYPFRIPQLTSGQKGLEGDIYAYVNKGILSHVRDTVEFNAFLFDQQHHMSPYVRTPEVILQH